MCLLGSLDGEEAYGYELMRRLEERGIGPVPGGSLYPALLRLEKLGYLAAEWRAGEGGPGRKFYSLTREGQVALDEGVRAWRAFTGAVDAVVGVRSR